MEDLGAGVEPVPDPPAKWLQEQGQAQAQEQDRDQDLFHSAEDALPTEHGTSAPDSGSGAGTGTGSGGMLSCEEMGIKPKLPFCFCLPPREAAQRRFGPSPTPLFRPQCQHPNSNPTVTLIGGPSLWSQTPTPWSSCRPYPHLAVAPGGGGAFGFEGVRCSAVMIF